MPLALKYWPAVLATLENQHYAKRNGEQASIIASPMRAVRFDAGRNSFFAP